MTSKTVGKCITLWCLSHFYIARILLDILTDSNLQSKCETNKGMLANYNRILNYSHVTYYTFSNDKQYIKLTI